MSPLHTESNANRQLHDAYRSWLRRGMAAAGIVHMIVLAFAAMPVVEPLAETPDEPVSLIELRYRIPPPPQELARPAVPTISDEAAIDDVAIAPTDLDVPPVEAPAPSQPEAEAAPTTTFVPYTVAPRCATGCGNEELLAHFPRILRKAGVACSAIVGLHIDVDGRVTDARIVEPSGIPACDRALETWARTTRWTSAYNRDVPVAVWIEQPVTVTTE